LKREPKSAKEYGSLYERFIKKPVVKKKGKKKEHWYVKFCRRAGRTFKAKNEFKKVEFKMAIDFLGWDLKPREVNAAPMFALVLALVAVIPGFFMLYYMVFMTGQLPLMALMYGAPMLVILPFFLVFYLQNYPLKAADAEKMKSITYIPEIVNYLVMSMKLTPNLEKAVAFAAEHGRGKIAADLKNITWQTKIGAYNTMEEGLDDLAYKWGKFSDEFKHALMMIRASVIEINEAKRYEILDKAVTDTLEGLRDEMTKYAVRMRQPSIYLYYVGILLPLMLIIMLPIGAMMAKLPIAQTWVMIVLYNIAIPIGAIFFAAKILKTRPPVYMPPKIPDTYPGLPKKGHIKVGKTMFPAIVLALIAGAGIYFACTMFLEPMMNPYPPSWDLEAQEAWFPFFQAAGIVLAGAAAASIYLYGTSYAKRKVQKELMKMETEFQDSVYVMASRLGENRPMEEAMDYTAKFLGGTKISVLYSKTVDNIRNLGMTVDMALFDPVYGSLKNVPSESIRGSMRIVVDSIALGVEQAARALIALSMQLRDSQKVKVKIQELMSEITAMMRSIAFFIAPLVLGVTTALQKIIISALSGLSTTPGAEAVGSLPAGVSVPSLPFTSLGSAEMLHNIPDSFTFLLIIAIYVIEVTIILVYFVSKIEEGDNPLALKMNLAMALPIAMIFYFFAAFFAAQMVVTA
jgi:hypothetical protein